MNPPHTHPRATEILTVLEGTLEVGFVTSNPDNILIRKILQKGDVFVFPIGLIHYQRNIGHVNAVAIAALSSQNPGVITIANAVFGSKPDIGVEVLTKKAFQLDKALVNGMVCKDPKLVEAGDFFFTGLHVPGNTSNTQGSKVTPVNVAQIPGLNTLGSPWETCLYSYQRNIGYVNAVAIAALSSQNPGAITIANAVFGSNPAISSEVLTKAFQLDKSTVTLIQAKF
ncbi:hypothetical protein MKW92_015466 [Papaver armeniacum]|nr:hypothetical protein MKW92_015466 [Papaver armeniacum]